MCNKIQGAVFSDFIQASLTQSAQSWPNMWSPKRFRINFHQNITLCLSIESVESDISIDIILSIFSGQYFQWFRSLGWSCTNIPSQWVTKQVKTSIVVLISKNSFKSSTIYNSQGSWSGMRGHPLWDERLCRRCLEVKCRYFWCKGKAKYQGKDPTTGLSLGFLNRVCHQASNFWNRLVCQ